MNAFNKDKAEDNSDAQKKCPFEPFSKAVLEHAPKAYNDLAKACPVYHYQGKFDYYIASKYKDVRNNILWDNELWTAKYGVYLKGIPEQIQSVGLSQDPPGNNETRKIVLDAFSPAGLEHWATVINRLADELIDTMLAMPEGRGNFFELFALPLPARLMCVMMGVPEEDWPFYKETADAINHHIMDEPTPGSEMPVFMAVYERVLPHIESRRAQLAQQGLEPDIQHVGTVLPNDFLSRMLCSKSQGRPLSDIEIVSLASALTVGGNETTISLIGHLLWRLLETPALWEEIKANPELIEAAIEESLRLDPPLLGFSRQNTRETELQGVKIPERSTVWYSIAAANRDPEAWSNPDEFNLHRSLDELRQHVSFGKGGHLCLGSRLARLEVKLVFEKLVQRMPKLRVDGECRQAITTFHAWAKNYIPVRWD